MYIMYIMYDGAWMFYTEIKCPECGETKIIVEDVTRDLSTYSIKCAKCGCGRGKVSSFSFCEESIEENWRDFVENYNKRKNKTNE